MLTTHLIGDHHPTVISIIMTTTIQLGEVWKIHFYDLNFNNFLIISGMESRPAASTSSSNERYLFDPRNPKKPILAQRGGRSGSSGVPVSHEQQRFPMDPRFVPPPTMYPGSSGGQPLRMPSNYRPPFPAANQGGQAVQSLGDPKSLASEGGEAAQVQTKILITKII